MVLLQMRRLINKIYYINDEIVTPVKNIDNIFDLQYFSVRYVG